MLNEETVVSEGRIYLRIPAGGSPFGDGTHLVGQEHEVGGYTHREYRHRECAECLLHTAATASDVVGVKGVEQAHVGVGVETLA